jgi:hypothetical protein
MHDVKVSCRPVYESTFAGTIVTAQNVYIRSQLPTDMLAVAPKRFNLYTFYVLCHLFHNSALYVMQANLDIVRVISNRKK